MLFALSVLTVNAQAEDSKALGEQKVPLGFRVISVQDNSQYSIGVKIAAKDIQKGVFITATGGWRTTYPKTVQLLKDIFKSKGVKVVDKPEDADLGLMFRGVGDFSNFGEVENDQGSLQYGESSRLAILMSTIYAVAIHGNLSAIRGNEFGSNKNAVAEVLIVVARNPKLTSRGHLDGGDMKTIDSEISYHLNRRPENGEHFASTLLKADVSEFIDQHFEGLPAPAEVIQGSDLAPVSAVSAASAPKAAN